MPDTVFIHALRGIMEVSEVDANDIKEWLADMRGDMKAVRDSISAHGERLATVEAKATSAHKRLDEIKVDIADVHASVKETGGPGWKGWVGIIGALAGAAIGIIGALHNAETKADKSPAAVRETK